MKKHKFTIFLLIVVLALLGLAYYSFLTYQQTTVSINGFVFKTDVVKNAKELERGLSGQETLADDQAMLFIFPDKNKRVFWMKEMNFNIDLLWIDGDKVIAYEKNMPAPDKNQLLDALVKYNSPSAVDKVLEIKAGLIDVLGIKVGDIIKFNI
ncbi:MAG: DUF192 domain-containing protein [Patescibacteria group bacterium]|jgi:hypothetical protein